VLASALEAFGALALVADARFLLVAAEAAEGVGTSVVAAALVRGAAAVAAGVVAANLFDALALVALRLFALGAVALLRVALGLFAPVALAGVAALVRERVAVRVAALPAFRHAPTLGLFALLTRARLRIDGLPAGFGVALALLLAFPPVALRLLALPLPIRGALARLVVAFAGDALRALGARALGARLFGARPFRLRALRRVDATALAFAGLALRRRLDAARLLRARPVLVASAFAPVLGERRQAGGDGHAGGQRALQHATGGQDLLHGSPLMPAGAAGVAPCSTAGDERILRFSRRIQRPEGVNDSS